MRFYVGQSADTIREWVWEVYRKKRPGLEQAGSNDLMAKIAKYVIIYETAIQNRTGLRKTGRYKFSVYRFLEK